MRFATTSTPAASRPMSQIGTTETGTAPRLFANACHTTRPTTTPTGTPITMPTAAIVVACQATLEATWRFTNPTTFKRPTSCRRRDTLTTSKWSRVAAPNTAKMAPNMSGKLTASPKLMSEVGVTARVVTDRYSLK